MVELSSSTDPFQHGFPNVVFIIPAIVVVGLGDVAEELFNAMGGSEGAVPADGAAPAAGNPFNPDDFKMPTMEEFLSMLENMDNLSDEEKEELRAGVLQNSMRRKLQAGLSDYLTFFVMLSIMLAENPFVEALKSEALNDLLQDDEKRSLAQQFQENLRTLSDMFVNLSDDDKRQFAQEFKGKFVKSLSQLNEFSKQKKLVESTLVRPESESVGSFVDTLAAGLSGVGILRTDQLSPTPLGYGLLVGFVTLVIAFFGYKLYLSLTEKERKREEKLKAKQEKGKKKK
uniref:Uncharacterized protein n=1 Tax=Anopheles dirus TaxID=7168 RepID=A0A182NJQ3_9DIPT